MASVKRIARSVFESAGLSALWFRLYEWRHSLNQPTPPKTDAAGVPMPSRYLMTLVAGGADWRWYLASGETAAQAIAGFAAEAGRPLSSASRILDFGCGCGRIARHMKAHSPARLTGVDYNPLLARWCAHNLDGDFSVNGLMPPLNFPDAHFDVIYLHSIVTHLRPETQQAWLKELARVAMPGAAVIISFHDEDQPGFPDDPPARQRFLASGVHVSNDTGEGSNHIATFQTRAYTQDAFGQFFDVVRIAPSNQSPVGQAVAILRKRSA